LGYIYYKEDSLKEQILAPKKNKEVENEFHIKRGLCFFLDMRELVKRTREFDRVYIELILHLLGLRGYIHTVITLYEMTKAYPYIFLKYEIFFEQYSMF